MRGLGSLGGSSLAGSSLSGSILDGDIFGGGSPSALGAARRRETMPAYGRRVARMLMGRMQGLPPRQRETAMKAILGTLDASLPARAEQYAREDHKAGVPKGRALESGIARAVTQGLGTELAQLGTKRRGRPGALGQVVMATALPIETVMASMTPPKPTPGQCSADKRLVWTREADGTEHWVQVTASTVCTSIWEGSTTREVRTGGGGGVTVTDTTTGEAVKTKVDVAPTVEMQMMQIGPWYFPVEGSQDIHWSSALPSDWQGYIKRVVSKDANVQQVWLSQFVPGLTRWNNQYFGAGSSIPSKPGWNPVARFVHPRDSKDWGVYMSVSFKYSDKPINDPVANPPLLHITVRPIDKSWYEDIWDWIQKVVAKIVDVVKDAVNAVKDATCELLTQPGVSDAALTGAAAAPGVGTVGAGAGVMIGQKLCGGEKTPAPPIDEGGGGGSMWPMLALAGGGILLVYALTRK